MLTTAPPRHLQLLTKSFSQEGWPGFGRQVETKVVDRYTGQRHGDSHQRVNSVAVEGNHYQEYAAQAVNDREEQRQLQGSREERGG